MKNTSVTYLKSFKKAKNKNRKLIRNCKRFNLKHAALKVDCENCEYDLILNASDEALKAFDQMKFLVTSKEGTIVEYLG